MPSGTKNSSLRISPGLVGLRKLLLTFITVLSVIISDIDFHRTSARPTKNDSPLVVNPDAVKTLEFTFESFEPISGWGCQITQCFGIIQNVELSGSDSLDTGPPNAFIESVFFEEALNR
jgi:hypothetical protein